MHFSYVSNVSQQRCLALGRSDSYSPLSDNGVSCRRTLYMLASSNCRAPSLFHGTHLETYRGICELERKQKEATNMILRNCFMVGTFQQGKVVRTTGLQNKVTESSYLLPATCGRVSSSRVYKGADFVC